MARKIIQYRYYNEDNTSDNYPKADEETKKAYGLKENSLLLDGFVTGIFFSKTMPVVQLGVQSLPGTKFYLNSSTQPILVGTTGVYEPDLSGQAVINSIRFDLQSMINIRNNPNASLIIDIVYDTEEEV